MTHSNTLACLLAASLLLSAPFAHGRSGSGSKPDRADDSATGQTPSDGTKAAPNDNAPTAKPDADADADDDGMDRCRKSCEARHEGNRAPRVSIAFGGSWEHYTGENLVTNNVAGQVAGMTHFDVDLDIGVYFRPATRHLVFGLALDFASDTWSNSPQIVHVQQVFIGGKAMYYFSGEIGTGLCAHGDLGLVAFDNLVGNQTSRTTQSTDTSSPLGYGVRLGGGYAFRVSHRVSLFAAVDWSFRSAGASTAMPVTLLGGVMF